MDYSIERQKQNATREGAMLRALQDHANACANAATQPPPVYVTTLADRIERLGRLEHRLRQLAQDFNTVLGPVDGGNIHATPFETAEVASQPTLMQVMDGHMEHLDFYEGVLREQLDRLVSLIGEQYVSNAPTVD